MVRLKGFYPCSRRETDMPAALLRGKVLIGPGITALKPEAGRSIPEQDEVALTSDGGSQGCCSAKHSFDLGIVVKGQSNWEIARTLRNAFRCSLCCFVLEVELLIGCEGFTAYQIRPNSEC